MNAHSPTGTSKENMALKLQISVRRFLAAIQDKIEAGENLDDLGDLDSRQMAKDKENDRLVALAKTHGFSHPELAELERKAHKGAAHMGVPHWLEKQPTETA